MPNTWIFQANPRRFDIDGFLATSPTTTTWLVTRYKEQIATGDQVFIWRSIGDGADGDGGVIAEAVVIQPTERMKDDSTSRPFWRGDAEGDIADRAVLRIVRVATKRETIRRKWLKEDPILHELTILGMANATNYAVPSNQAARLNALWLKTGHDWSRAESVAGLWAYARTYGGEVSKLPHSPVALVSLMIGRAIGGVYNKVMNFRALDPRDSRAGMSGGSEVDEQVWNDFFDAGAAEFRVEALDAEFNRLWGGFVEGSLPTDEAEATVTKTSSEAAQLLTVPIEELLARYAKGRASKPGKPRAKAAKTRLYERDPLVVAIAKKRAEFQCEVPDCNHQLFLDSQGNPYCEVHHLVTLAEGGEDSLENVACLCPSHHREIHLGACKAELTASLSKVRSNN